MTLPDDTATEDQNRIHETKIKIADNIRQAIMTDIEGGKFSDYELAGRLGSTLVGVTAFKSRKTWTLDYAIIAAQRLGYRLGSISIAVEGNSP